MPSVFDKPSFNAAAYPHHFTGELLIATIAGGTPTDPKVAEGWLRTKLADKDDLIREAVAEVMVERGVDAETAAQIVSVNKHLNGFKRNQQGLYIDGRQLKACIKEAACVRWPMVRWGPSQKGTKGFFAEHVFVTEDRLHLGVDQPTDVVTTFPKGRHGTSIQLSEYIEEAKVGFTVYTDYNFKVREWAMLWLTAQNQGIGAMRSQGFGRFEVTRWDKAS